MTETEYLDDPGMDAFDYQAVHGFVPPSQAGHAAARSHLLELVAGIELEAAGPVVELEVHLETHFDNQPVAKLDHKPEAGNPENAAEDTVIQKENRGNSIAANTVGVHTVGVGDTILVAWAKQLGQLVVVQMYLRADCRLQKVQEDLMSGLGKQELQDE